MLHNVLLLLSVIILGVCEALGEQALPLSIFVDLIILYDIINKIRFRQDYLRRLIDWLDVFTIWLLLMHWILIAYEVVDVSVDAWIFIRYSMILLRARYFLQQSHRGVWECKLPNRMHRIALGLAGKRPERKTTSLEAPFVAIGENSCSYGSTLPGEYGAWYRLTFEDNHFDIVGETNGVVPDTVGIEYWRMQ